MNWLQQLGGATGLMPHGVCFLLRPDLILLHVTADVLIALAYFSIPITLVYFAMKKDQIPFKSVLGLFAAFITLCGLTHVFGMVTIWYPVYYLEGVVKILTAMVSVATAIILIPLVPRALNMRTATELEASNAQLRDEIAHRAEVEAQLQATVEQLRETNSELERFAYIASHDLQAPLRTIGSFSGLLTKRFGDDLDDEAREYIDYIGAGVADMQALIADLLQLSRVSSKQAEIQIVNSREVAERAVDQLRADLDSVDARVNIGPLPDLQVDGRWLQQIIQNLVSNGIKFQPKGQAPVISIDARRSEDGWVFAVADNGIGLAPDDRKRIFQVFRRLHTSDEYPGTGIGLALVHKLVNKMGGTITVDGAPGAGTVFSFSVPDRLPEIIKATALPVTEAVEPDQTDAVPESR